MNTTTINAINAINALPESTRKAMIGQDRDEVMSTLTMRGGTEYCPKWGFLRRPISWRCELHKAAYLALLDAPLI